MEPSFRHPAPIDRSRRPRLHPRRLSLSALLAGLVTLLAPLLVAAFPEPPYFGPPAGFSVAESEHLRYFVQDGAPLDANAFVIAYGGFAERAYADLGMLFPAPTGKIEIAVYHNDADYAAAIQNAPRPEVQAGGVQANPGVHDIALSLPLFTTRSELAAENSVRHAIAHVIVQRTAAGQAPRGFEEGLAQYVERPDTQRLARIAALLQNANQRDDLLTWSDLNRPQPANADPALVAAHAYAVVAFLVERHGLRVMRDFIASLQTEPDWRAAMRTSYKRSPGELEEQWREDLPRWVAGGWRDNLFAAFDLQPARDLLAKAHYAAAKAELERSLRLYTDLGDTTHRAEVEQLLRLGDAGLQAEALMSQTQEALERFTYDRAQTLLTQVRAQYAALPEEQRPTDLIDRYEMLATTGLQATANLEEAQRLSRRWADYPQARSAAVRAGAAFAQLGDSEMVERAEVVLDNLDDRQRRLVLMLGALAALTIAWLAVWLWARGPAELEWA
ncbi:MAG: hypothetical protein M3354_05315 [Chloroflexota bacterium]|nr:hypothetical protein [Chloroflexota bacterium]